MKGQMDIVCCHELFTLREPMVDFLHLADGDEAQRLLVLPLSPLSEIYLRTRGLAAKQIRRSISRIGTEEQGFS